MVRNRNINRLLVIASFLMLVMLVLSCNSKKEYITSSGSVFGTVYNITYQSDKDYTEEISQTLQDVDNSLSPFNKNSIITKINNNQDTLLNEHFISVYTLAMKVSEDTDGAFDITVAPLTNVWGFGFKNNTQPTKEQVDSLLQFVGYKKVSLEGKTVVKQNPGIMLDCSAIAKGYGVDAVANMLTAKGVENFLVEIGGEIVTKGVSPRGTDWRIGIVKPVDDPLNQSKEMQQMLDVHDVAMATSGNYRNFYIADDGKRYAHTIDPRTGYPIQHNILSATVFGPTCAVADAYATAFMVVGFEKAKEILDRHPEFMAYLIYSDDKGQNKVWHSPKLKVE
ncbi:MAG: FAD:protein FMN transferase [Bacteroidaceae bacterium]|nr:FAD:protein FMN transferase [Bacteroidaceae bacterium]